MKGCTPTSLYMDSLWFISHMLIFSHWYSRKDFFSFVDVSQIHKRWSARRIKRLRREVLVLANALLWEVKRQFGAQRGAWGKWYIRFRWGARMSSLENLMTREEDFGVWGEAKTSRRWNHMTSEAVWASIWNNRMTRAKLSGNPRIAAIFCYRYWKVLCHSARIRDLEGRSSLHPRGQNTRAYEGSNASSGRGSRLGGIVENHFSQECRASTYVRTLRRLFGTRSNVEVVLIVWIR